MRYKVVTTREGDINKLAKRAMSACDNADVEGSMMDARAASR
jgi:hypothetical protein